MSWGLCQQLWSQEWGGKEVTGRVGVQAVVQKGRRALRKGGIKRNLRIKRREAGSKLGHCWCSWHPAAGPALSRDPSPPPASEEFGVSLSRKDRAASDTQEERPERRNPGAAPEVGEGRLAGSGAWCQEPGWRDMLGSTEGQGLRVEDPHAQAQNNLQTPTVTWLHMLLQPHPILLFWICLLNHIEPLAPRPPASSDSWQILGFCTTGPAPLSILYSHLGLLFTVPPAHLPQSPEDPEGISLLQKDTTQEQPMEEMYRARRPGFNPRHGLRSR
ncbi:uncharacterized protein LOC133231397 isoform X1 [Bos javanicus]|uniref:uncharacterized protein LOC133231397 isoform X1 n=1 Tax=Bos javanicus TaxID=9906 RepID=UPI002AA6E4B3|nr:uncharacterized protein LOC133231397 isoform X1 [Bos javanicus]